MTWRAKSGCIIKTMIWIMDSTRRFAKSNERVGIRKIVFLMQGRHLQLSHQTGPGRCSQKILVLVLWVQNSSRGFSYWLAVEQCNLYIITNLPVMGFSTFNGFLICWHMSEERCDTNFLWTWGHTVYHKFYTKKRQVMGVPNRNNIHCICI